MDNSRHRADSAKKYELYFKLIGNKIQQYQIEPRYIYNIDEKGFMRRIVSTSHRVFKKQL